MKTLNITSPNQLFNHTGILTHAGDYAGKYQDDAVALFDKHFSDDNVYKDISNSIDFWADIMVNEYDGSLYIVAADNSLTGSGNCVYHEIVKDDCESAYNDAQEKVR